MKECKLIMMEGRNGLATQQGEEGGDNDVRCCGEGKEALVT